MDNLIELLNKVFAHENGVPCKQWSIVELGLSLPLVSEIKAIPCEEFGDILNDHDLDDQMFQIAELGEFNKEEIVGLAVLLAETYEIRDRENIKQYQQTILEMDWPQNFRQSYLYDSFNLRHQIMTSHQEMILNIVNKLNLRDAYHLEMPHQKTHLLQSGLTKQQWLDILDEEMPLIPTNPGSPQIARMLYGVEGDDHWKSEEFIISWDILRLYQQEGISRADAESGLARSNWIPEEWLKEIFCKIELIQNNQIQTHTRLLETGMRNSPLGEPKIYFANNAEFISIIDLNALNRICGDDCKAMRLTGPHGFIGEIARQPNEPWKRVCGNSLNDDLSIAIRAAGISSGEVLIELTSLSPDSGFFTQVTLRLWHDDAVISRYDHNGHLEIDAWHKRLPPNRIVTLAFPSGWEIIPQPDLLEILYDSGLTIAQFSAEQRPINVLDAIGTSYWNSTILDSPDRSIPQDLKALKPEFVIDQAYASYVTGHIDVPPTFQNSIEKVTIGDQILEWGVARTSNKIRIGGAEIEGCPFECLWKGPSIKLRLRFNNQTLHVRKTCLVRMDRVCPGVIILSKSPSGRVSRVQSEKSFHTLARLRMTRFRMIPKSVSWNQNLSIGIYQCNKYLGSMPGRGLFLGNSQHLGIPFYYRCNQDALNDQDLMTFMRGVVEQGCIDFVDLIEADGTNIAHIHLLTEIEPSPQSEIHQGHHILLLFRTAEKEKPCLKKISLNFETICPIEESNWSQWKVKIPINHGVLCGLAISYGTTAIGMWLKPGNNDFFDSLLDSGRHEGDALILCQSIRLFHPPIFKRRELEQAMQNLIDQLKCIYAIDWDGVDISDVINSPNYHQLPFEN